MRESRNKLTEKEMELARMLMSECNTTADVQSKDTLNKSGFLRKKPWIYGLFSEKTTLNQCFLKVIFRLYIHRSAR